MKTLLKYAIIALIIGCLGALGAIIWAASGTRPADRMTEILFYSQVKPAAAAGDTFTVMTYNLGYLSGMSNALHHRESKEFYRRNLARVIALLNDIKPDFVGVQEIDGPSFRSHCMNQIDSLARGAGYAQAAFAVNWDKRYVPYPYWPPEANFGRVLSGQAVFSRFPILEQERHILAWPREMPFYWDRFYLDRLAQVVRIDVGREILIINVHLEAYEQPTRARQAAQVLKLLRRLRRDYPVIVLGDFNGISPYMGVAGGGHSALSAADRYDPTVAMFVNEPGMAAAFPPKAFVADESEIYTFSSGHPFQKIDYIFYDSEKIAPVNAYVARAAGQASDHLPVVMRFRLLK